MKDRNKGNTFKNMALVLKVTLMFGAALLTNS